jgi:hypothetical protein
MEIQFSESLQFSYYGYSMEIVWIFVEISMEIQFSESLQFSYYGYSMEIVWIHY